MSDETIFEWAERMVGLHSWQEHEGAAWIINRGGSRAGGPMLEFSMDVRTAPRPPAPRTSFQPHGWWRWKLKVSFIPRSGGEKYRVTGHVTSLESGKEACERAMMRLIAAFRVSDSGAGT